MAASASTRDVGRCSTPTSSCINMGPQHPSTHGVLRVVLRLDGEKVVDSDVVIGYLHRGIEKLSENRNWTQIILLTDRMDYVAAATNNVGYCETVEKLMSLEVPRRARYVRTILVRAAADRQPLPVARHARDGHRRDDGVPLRVPRARADPRSVRGVLRRAAHLQLDAHRRPAARHSRRAGTRRSSSSATSWTRRSTSTRSCSRTTASGSSGPRASASSPAPSAIALGLSGPPLRGSGVPRDVRKDEPYAAYDEMEFDVPIGTAGDTYDRYLVRMEEFRQSIRIIRQATRRAARRADRRQGAAPDQAAGGRDLSRDRVAERRARLLHRQRRQVDQPVPLPRAAAVVLQPAGAAAR